MNNKTLTRFFSRFLLLFLSLHFAMGPRMSTALISIGYTSQKTCFSVDYHGEKSSYKITPLFVLPNEKVTINVETEDTEAIFQLDNWTKVSPTAWTWTAPRKAGFYPATVTETKSGETIALQVFVMIPYSKLEADRLNGYRIGKYPPIPQSKQKLYSLPRGFIEVTPENRNALISPHFTLGQFLCKQQGPYPKYVVLREKLLFKLENLLEHVNAEGIPCRTLSVMSGYRTPYYNKAIGNVRFSRHLWGDAADIFINKAPTAVGMEDVNGDGREDAEDAEVLYRIVDRLDEQASLKQFIGGIGWYKPTREHGPFVHVDVRGTATRWGSN